MTVQQMMSLPFGMASTQAELLALFPNATAVNVTANFVKFPIEIQTAAQAVALVETTPGRYEEVEVSPFHPLVSMKGSCHL